MGNTFNHLEWETWFNQKTWTEAFIHCYTHGSEPAKIWTNFQQLGTHLQSNWKNAFNPHGNDLSNTSKTWKRILEHMANTFKTRRNNFLELGKLHNQKAENTC